MSSTSDAADVADASRADAVRADAVRAAAESRAIVAAGLGGLSGLIGGLIVFAGRLVGLADGCRVPSSRPARCSSPEWC